MIIEANSNACVDVGTYQHTDDDKPEISLSIDPGTTRGCLRIAFDENHAQALVLALQAAIAEVQARAVSL